MNYSPTQINMFLRCSASWMFRYIEKLKIPPNGNMSLGRAYHKGMETNGRYKIEKLEDMPTDDVCDAFSTAFDKEIKEAELEKDEKGKEGEMKDGGIAVTKEYQTTAAPNVQPVSVEERIEIPFENVDYGIMGFIDMIDDKHCIHDHKFTKKSPSKNKATGEYVITPRDLIQISIYSLATGLDDVQLDYAVNTKTPKIIQLPTVAAETDKNFVLDLTGRVHHAIEQEIFIPNRDSMLCSRKNCGYWGLCEKKYGGTVKS